MTRVRALGIDIGGTGIKWAVLDGVEMIESGSIATPRTSRDDVLGVAAALISDHGARADAVGVTFPGLIDTVARTTLFVPNLPGDWRGIPVAERLEANTTARVSLLNDARAFGYAELRAGAGRDHTDVLFITLGTGVGGAIAKDGRLMIGAVDSLGEVGHTIVENDGELCGCGGRGCMETVASASAITARVLRPRLMSLSPMLEALDPAGITTAEIAAAARANDPWCAEAFARAGRGIGIAAGNVASLLRITAVVIGGGLLPAFDLIAPHAAAALAEREPLIGGVVLRPAELGAVAGAVGAALYATDQLRTRMEGNDQ